MATAKRTRSYPPVRVSSYWRVAPQPAQYVFLSLPHLEALYGGAAGGGKSFALLMAALQYVDVPGYDALILRRTYPQLAAPGGLMDVARNWLRNTDASWSDTDKQWRFPSGATLNFGYLKTESDLDNYAGPSYSFIGFDELTQFPEHHFRFLYSRLRKAADSPVPVRMRAASNPGGRGHRWVKQRFLVEGLINDRLFVPAKLSDNPGLDQESYLLSLAELDPVTRRQLLDGDWDAKPAGAMFDRELIEIVDEPPPPQTLRVVRFWDEAATQPTESRPDPDWTVGLKLGRHIETDVHYVLDVRRFRHRPGKVKQLVRRTAREDGTAIPVRFEQEPGASGVKAIHEWQSYLGRWAVKGVRSSADKVVRAAPVAARAELGKLKVVAGPWATDFLDEVEDFPEGDHDDIVDALSGAYGELQGGTYSLNRRDDDASSQTITGDLMEMQL